MTLWSVADQDTGRLMVDFYTQVQNSGNAAQALTEVQRQWLVKLRKERGLPFAVTLAGLFILCFQGPMR
jgi:CHAT domain-containing protein